MRRNFIKIIVLISIFFRFQAAVFSQDKNGGSVYSVYGLGDLDYSSSIRAEGMGITGLSLHGNYNNTLNPAAWTKIKYTIFSTGLTIQGFKSTDGSNTSNRVYADFEGFNLSIPINSGNGWIMNVGLNKYSIVNYDIQTRGSSLGEAFTQYYRGNGGLNRFSAGLSYLLFKYLSLGVQFNYTFGDIEKTNQIDFDNTAIFDTRNTITNTISGYYFNTGLIFDGFGKLFSSKKLNDLNLGLYFSTPAKFNSAISGTFEKVSKTDSVSFTEGKLDIPLTFGVGISKEINNRLIIAADFIYRNWDKYKYYGQHPGEIKNSYKAGVGIEFTESKKPDASFLNRISLRLGANYTADYIRVNGYNLVSYGFSIGFGLPISAFNKLDIVFNYTRKGKTSDGLVREDIFKISAAINISELWFIRPKDY
jgi:hypothetical protein